MFHFLKEVLVNFFQIGGIFPSTPFAAKKIAGLVPKDSQNILEYGPGTGVVTTEILKRLSQKTKIYAVDLNPNFIRILERLKDSRIESACGDVLEYAEKMRERVPQGVDAVVSGIPLSFLDDPSREALLLKSKAALKPGGKIIIYQNSPEALALIKKHFHHVKLLIELRNIPPYFIIVGIA